MALNNMHHQCVVIKMMIPETDLHMATDYLGSKEDVYVIIIPILQITSNMTWHYEMSILMMVGPSTTRSNN